MVRGIECDAGEFRSAEREKPAKRFCIGLHQSLHIRCTIFYRVACADTGIGGEYGTFRLAVQNPGCLFTHFGLTCNGAGIQS